MELIQQGAEAKIWLDKDVIIKERFSKQYRHSEIDADLRKSRTKREVKVISKLQKIGVKVPTVLNTDLKNMKISMSFIDGSKLKDVFKVEHGFEIGKIVAKLHSNKIIHGDLTTSNMIFKKGIWLIDFGLSFFSDKVEDKAVDLHVLRQALESKHYECWEEAFNNVIEGYKEYSEFENVMHRLLLVETRGRNKSKQ